MEKFRGGNIIKDPYGSIKIFIEYYKGQHGVDMFRWISFDHSGSYGVSPVLSQEQVMSCLCNYNDIEPLYDCDRCNGSGEYTSIRHGESEYKLLASNGKDYLKDLLNGALSKLS